MLFNISLLVTETTACCDVTDSLMLLTANQENLPVAEKAAVNY